MKGQIADELLAKGIAEVRGMITNEIKPIVTDLAELAETVRSEVTASRGATQPATGYDETASKRPPQKSSAPARRLNAWLEVPSPKVGQFFRILINIGAAPAGALGTEPLPELDWRGVESLNLIVGLTCIDCEITPDWQRLMLPHTGDSAIIKFSILCPNAGTYDFTVRVYLAKQMIQLQSLSFSIAVESVQVQARVAP